MHEHRPRVYISQYQESKDLTPASHFGEIVILLRPEDIAKGTNHCITVMQDILCESTAEDSIVLVGDPLIMGLAFYLMVHFGDGQATALRWDKNLHRYNPEIISL